MTAIVTGAASGIGAAIARALITNGQRVICLDLVAPDWSNRLLDSIQLDLLDPAATRDAARTIAAREPISHVIHNAGIIRPALLADVDPLDLQALTQLHLAAPLALVQAVLPAMRAERFGRIVLMSSRAALGLPTRTAYSATKAALIGLTRTWALELAADGITVNAVAPGPIGGTAMFHDVVPAGSAREAALAASIPVRRLGTPQDVARAVMFFCDRDNGFVTGQTLFVCGGASVGTLTI